ncbi:hypothetical protein ET495_03350 [Xylanimonas allomyrinae]|uniref:Uncharacterized protein n=1 Tax=Xylanimonas allomyrinae TaxID=2509459 RepID=A0A4P6EMF9_9MICO|nr:hypothetical protein [Xylanimonas allomyrinae]QAY62449.1 hypothetical protein ET495_03350 [Xylanimonas allomyrinae]
MSDAVAEGVDRGMARTAEEITHLSQDLAKKDAEIARLQASLKAKELESRGLAARRQSAQAELEGALNELARVRVEQEDRDSMALVLVPGLFVSGVAGWALNSAIGARRRRRVVQE